MPLEVPAQIPLVLPSNNANVRELFRPELSDVYVFQVVPSNDDNPANVLTHTTLFDVDENFKTSFS